MPGGNDGGDDVGAEDPEDPMEAFLAGDSDGDAGDAGEGAAADAGATDEGAAAGEAKAGTASEGGEGEGVVSEFEELLSQVEDETLQGSLRAALEKAAEKPEAEAPLIVPAATAANPLASIISEADLDKYTNDVEGYLGWLEENPEGGTYGNETITPDRVVADLKIMRGHLKAAPKHRAYLQKSAEVRDAVFKEFPELGKAGSALLKAAKELILNGTVNANDPEHLRHVADLLEGRRIRLERAKGFQFIPTKPKPVAATPKAGGKGVVVPRKPGVAEGEVDVSKLVERGRQGDERAASALMDAFLK